MAIYWGKVLLWIRLAVLIERDVGFLIGAPSIPMGKAWAVRISGLGKVSPIGLDDLREFQSVEVNGSQRKPRV